MAVLRPHLALTVTDVARAIPFYEALFGTTPEKVKLGYAKFSVADPALKFTLTQGGARRRRRRAGDRRDGRARRVIRRTDHRRLDEPRPLVRPRASGTGTIFGSTWLVPSSAPRSARSPTSSCAASTSGRHSSRSVPDGRRHCSSASTTQAARRCAPSPPARRRPSTSTPRSSRSCASWASSLPTGHRSSSRASSPSRQMSWSPASATSTGSSRPQGPANRGRP
jgi:catechol 2,3-dioxygenase-like lactoylglutathione lyase family enzyme